MEELVLQNPLTGPQEPNGNVEGQLVYAIGDVHGCYTQMCALLAKITADVVERAGDRVPVIIFCGDYVDRGPDSARVLDALCWLKRHSPHDVRFLMGNHDRVMLEYIRDPVATSVWMRFGGDETLRSYGVQPPAEDSGSNGHLVARDDLLERLPVAHLRFLEQLELMLTIGDYLFVHAGVRAGRPLHKQVEEDLLWIREGFVDRPHGHDKIVVHGHTWTSSQPDLLPHRIGIDTGAYETGVLTAVRLEDGSATMIATG